MTVGSNRQESTYPCSELALGVRPAVTPLASRTSPWLPPWFDHRDADRGRRGDHPERSISALGFRKCSRKHLSPIVVAAQPTQKFSINAPPDQARPG
jgi:hypothetical protein